MKILFYQYGAEDWLSIGYLSAILKREGHQTDLLLEAPLSLYMKLPFISEERILRNLLDKARRFNPDLFAVSSTTDAFPYAARIIRLIKEHLNVPVIVGGIQATILPEYVMEETQADMLCIGEGEEALLELVENMRAGRPIDNICNLWIRSLNGTVRNPVRPLLQDLDTLPFPDKEIFRQYGCLTGGYNIMTGRGCPYACSYCCNQFYKKLYSGNGPHVRRRSAVNVIKEITDRKESHQITSVYFWDDSFTCDKSWLIDFLALYEESVALPFHCLSRPEKIDLDIATRLKKAGCTHINMGVESGSARIRSETLYRHYSDEQLIEAAGIIQRSGIRLNTFIILGIPGETAAEMWQTAELNKKIRPDGVFAFLLKPFPGTDVAAHATKLGLLDDSEIKILQAGGGGKIQSPEHDILPRHPFGVLARNMMIYLPLQNKLPSFLSSFIEKRVNNEKLFNRFLILLSLLMVDTSRTYSKFQSLFNTLLQLLRGNLR